MDEAGINDDRDMLQEMRLVLRIHRVPGMADDVPTATQVFRMATTGGAKTTAFSDSIGALEVERWADLVLVDWDQISWPYLDPETPVLDAVLQRAKTSGVRTVMCDGEVVYKDGKFTRVDRDGALRALHEDLLKALSDEEVERRHLSTARYCHTSRRFTPIISTRRSISPSTAPALGYERCSPRLVRFARHDATVIARNKLTSQSRSLVRLRLGGWASQWRAMSARRAVEAPSCWQCASGRVAAAITMPRRC